MLMWKTHANTSGDRFGSFEVYCVVYNMGCSYVKKNASVKCEHISVHVHGNDVTTKSWLKKVQIVFQQEMETGIELLC